MKFSPKAISFVNRKVDPLIRDIWTPSKLEPFRFPLSLFDVDDFDADASISSASISSDGDDSISSEATIDNFDDDSSYVCSCQSDKSFDSTKFVYSDDLNPFASVPLNIYETAPNVIDSHMSKVDKCSSLVPYDSHDPEDDEVICLGVVNSIANQSDLDDNLICNQLATTVTQSEKAQFSGDEVICLGVAKAPSIPKDHNLVVILSDEEEEPGDEPALFESNLKTTGLFDDSEDNPQTTIKPTSTDQLKQTAEQPNSLHTKGANIETTSKCRDVHNRKKPPLTTSNDTKGAPPLANANCKYGRDKGKLHSFDTQRDNLKKTGLCDDLSHKCKTPSQSHSKDPLAHPTSSRDSFPTKRVTEKNETHHQDKDIISTKLDIIGRLKESTKFADEQQHRTLHERIPRKRSGLMHERATKKTKVSRGAQLLRSHANYPKHLLKNIDEIHSLCDSVRLDPRYSHLLTPNISNLCLVFEEATDEYLKENTSASLDKLGRGSHERLSKVKKMHVVMQSPHQAYVARDAEGPHYHDILFNILHSLSAYEGHLQLRLYDPLLNHRNDYLIVINEGAERYTQLVDWNHVEASSQTEGKATPDGGTSRLVHSKPIGIAGNQSCSRRNSSIGVSMPQLKPGSLAPGSVAVFKAHSQLAREMSPPWLDGTGEIYIDPIHQNRASMFANQISPDNLIEAAQMSMTIVRTLDGSSYDEHVFDREDASHRRPGNHSWNVAPLPMDYTYMLASHSDKLNPKHSKNPTMSVVMGISITRGNVRLATNSYGREAVDQYFERVDNLSPAVQAVLETVGNMPVCRQQFNNDTVRSGVRVEYLPGLEFRRTKCNMDPASYHNCVADFVIRLVDKYSLSYDEIVGVICAFERVANSALFFGAASLAMLQHSDAGPRSINRHRGAEFSRLLLKLALKFKAYWDEQSQMGKATRKVDHRRFNLYRQSSVPTRQVWRELVGNRTKLGLQVWSAHHSCPTAKSRRISICKMVTKLFFEQCENTAVLIGNHMVHLCSIIGIFPSWLRDYCYVDANCNWAKWMGNEYNLQEFLRSANGVSQLIETLRDAILKRHGLTYSIRVMENVLCKHKRCVTRITNDARWCDNHYAGQNVFTFDGDTITVNLGGTQHKELINGCLINHFPFGGDLLSPKQIAEAMGLSTSISSTTRMDGFDLPRELWSPQVSVDIDFPICGLPPIGHEGIAFLQTVFQEVIGCRR